MHIVLIIIGLVILYNFWDFLFYLIGGIFALASIFFAIVAKDEHKKADGMTITFTVMTIIAVIISYFAFNYQINSWNNPVLIAEEEAKKEAEDAENARLAEEKKAQEEAEKDQQRIKRISVLIDSEKVIYDEKFQEYMKSMDEKTAREKAFADLDQILKNQIESEQKIHEEKISAMKVQFESDKKLQEEEDKAQRVAQIEANNVAQWGDKATLKKYIEEIQPFVVKDYIKDQVGITGPLANGNIQSLAVYAFYMEALANEAKKSIPTYGEIAKQVAIYFECESNIASFYYNLKKDNKNTLDKAASVIMSGVQTPEAYSQRSAAENQIKAAAKWCDADLNTFYEQELIKKFLQSLKR